MKGIICGTGSAVPVGIVNNQDLTKLVETNDEWIRERTGIVRRHVAGSETTVSLAAEAAKRALADAKADAEEIDLIIVSTISSNVILPCTACEVQKEIGAVNAFCFDLNAACTGFVLAYQTACAYLACGRNHRIVGKTDQRFCTMAAEYGDDACGQHGYICRDRTGQNSGWIFKEDQPGGEGDKRWNLGRNGTGCADIIMIQTKKYVVQHLKT